MYVIAGSHTFGTYAATQWLAQPKNLRWVKRKCTRRRVWNFLTRRDQFDSIQVVLTVGALNRPEPMVMPKIGEPKVWYGDVDHEGAAMNVPTQKPNLYYFHTPVDYLKDYQQMLRAN